MWNREAGGRSLHFYLAGINNQNFLMRDRETGSWWQQVTGRAIAGDLAGSALESIPMDEISFGLWKSESPEGLVLAPVAGIDAKDYDGNWEQQVSKLPVPLSFPAPGLTDRDVILGVTLGGQSRAFPLSKVKGDAPVQDHLSGIPLTILTGPDGETVRIFLSKWNGAEIEFYRPIDRNDHSFSWQVLDSQGNTWNFEGCATGGPASGHCLEKVSFLKDYWFDWKNYHPQTTVYNH